MKIMKILLLVVFACGLASASARADSDEEIRAKFFPHLPQLQQEQENFKKLQGDETAPWPFTFSHEEIVTDADGNEIVKVGPSPETVGMSEKERETLVLTYAAITMGGGWSLPVPADGGRATHLHLDEGCDVRVYHVELRGEILPGADMPTCRKIELPTLP